MPKVSTPKPQSCTPPSPEGAHRHAPSLRDLIPQGIRRRTLAFNPRRTRTNRPVRSASA
ncbi:MAG: hypothetical protein ACI4X9_08780 [Kiritimatiellia bacterium]